jgi:crotonobetainyl-CoA:carnitine CoA-transferase CaiB-like acyl-CoA transferase
MNMADGWGLIDSNGGMTGDHEPHQHTADGWGPIGSSGGMAGGQGPAADNSARMPPVHGLKDLRVVDFSFGIAGAYCSKLFADAGADVVKVEPPTGDPLRFWSATGADLGGSDGAFFRFLHCSKRSVVGAPGDDAIARLVGAADLVIESFAPGSPDDDALAAVIAATAAAGSDPALVRLSITPYGRTGPYADRPVTEFIVQTECGSTLRRGTPEQEPFYAAGRITEYISAVFGAVGALAAVRRAVETGIGEHVDLAWIEAMAIAANTYSDLMYVLSGRPPIEAPPRNVELPSIEPTLDGWVGVNTNSRQQFNDFLVLIDRVDLMADEELPQVMGRKRRRDEWNAIVREYTTRHTTAEIVEKAAMLRIPVAPVCSGRTVLDHVHLRARGVFIKNPDGDFEQPRPSYMLDGEVLGPRSPAPRLGEHTGVVAWGPTERARAGADASPAHSAGVHPRLPLEGLRVLDATAWWAGPSSTGILAALGADVIHVESIQKPDGMRMTGFMAAPPGSDWWEYSAVFLAANSNKRSLTLDMAHPDGMEAMHRLIQRSDAVVENFSPRVFENFGLGWKEFHELAPRSILVRMPAFGLDGPWRDNVGFAQTMEQISGLAWITSHSDDQPRIQQGPCDPLAGMHSAFAVLVALAERDRTGLGSLLEVTMVEGALNAAAEQIVEWSAYGNEMQREGNRSPYAAPQGLYRCPDAGGLEQWLAVSCETDAHWHALRRALGDPAWAADGRFDTHAGRRAHHDELDVQLRAHAATIADPVAEADRLVSHGVPAAPGRDPRLNGSQPQLAARRASEQVEHPVVGTVPLPRPPFRFESVDHWIRMRPPTMGEHNREILHELGYDDDAIDRFEAEQVIGTRPTGV